VKKSRRQTRGKDGDLDGRKESVGLICHGKEKSAATWGGILQILPKRHLEKRQPALKRGEKGGEDYGKRTSKGEGETFDSLLYIKSSQRAGSNSPKIRKGGGRKGFKVIPSIF